MDQRTIGQILSNPEWLRQTLGEDRPIQASNDTPGMLQGGPVYQQTALPPYPSTFVPSQYPDHPTAQVPARPESEIVEVRGTIAYVARYRAEYFNDRDPQQMMALAQSVIMNETGTVPGEQPPPWFPDVQFWIQSFERIDPYATAQHAELERLRALKLEQERQFRIREAEVAERLRREQMLYGEPGTFSRADTLSGSTRGVSPQGGGAENGWSPGPIPGTNPHNGRGDWLGDILGDITGAIAGIHQRLEAMERRGADGPAGAGAAVHPDTSGSGDPDRAGGDGADAAAARRDPAERMAAEAYVDVAAEPARDLPVDAARDPVPEPGGGEEPEPVRARSYADRRQRKAPLTTT